MTTIADLIAAAVGAVDLGSPSAQRRGRNPQLPYVPVVLRDGRQKQVLARAFASHDEAVACADRVIAGERVLLTKKLADPRYRALRVSHGLPREISAVSA